MTPDLCVVAGVELAWRAKDEIGVSPLRCTTSHRFQEGHSQFK